jgi:hypothetical protein
MQKYFKEAVSAYKTFKAEETKLNSEFTDAKTSGNFSKQYLQQMAAENRQKISNLRKSSYERFDLIRSDLERELAATNTLNGSHIEDGLNKLLNSQITLTPEEFSSLAVKYKNSTVNSRLLRDAAKKSGYTLENYVSSEDVLNAFDTATERLKKSMFLNDGSLPFYASLPEAESATGALCGKALTRSFECYPTPNGLAETLQREAAVHAAEVDKIAESHADAFLTGFTGHAPERDILSVLSPEEKERAVAHARADGREEVTQADVTFVRDNLDEPDTTN